MTFSSNDNSTSSSSSRFQSSEGIASTSTLTAPTSINTDAHLDPPSTRIMDLPPVIIESPRPDAPPPLIFVPREPGTKILFPELRVVVLWDAYTLMTARFNLKFMPMIEYWQAVTPAFVQMLEMYKTEVFGPVQYRKRNESIGRAVTQVLIELEDWFELPGTQVPVGGSLGSMYHNAFDTDPAAFQPLWATDSRTPNPYDDATAGYSKPSVVDRWLQLLTDAVSSPDYFALVPVVDENIAAIFEQHVHPDHIVLFDPTNGQHSRLEKLQAALRVKTRSLQSRLNPGPFQFPPPGAAPPIDPDAVEAWVCDTNLIGPYAVSNWDCAQWRGEECFAYSSGKVPEPHHAFNRVYKCTTIANANALRSPSTAKPRFLVILPEVERELNDLYGTLHLKNPGRHLDLPSDLATDRVIRFRSAATPISHENVPLSGDSCVRHQVAEFVQALHDGRFDHLLEDARQVIVHLLTGDRCMNAHAWFLDFNQGVKGAHDVRFYHKFVPAKGLQSIADWDELLAR